MMMASYLSCKTYLILLKKHAIANWAVILSLRFPKKDQVESANQERLAALTGSAHEFDAEDICG